MLLPQQGGLLVLLPGTRRERFHRTQALDENAALIYQIDDGIDLSLLQGDAQALTEGINPVE